MNKQHKWSEVIKAWADSKEIQFRHITHEIWVDYLISDVPNFNDSSYEWRIKPEDAIIDKYIWFSNEIKCLVMSISSAPNVRFTLDPDTKALVKVELIR